MNDYITSVVNEHERKEELQWAAIIATGDQAKGMALVFIQKFCTAVHELEPAFANGSLKFEDLDFFKKRMILRLTKVLTVLRDNNLYSINGVKELENLLEKMEHASTLEKLANLAEEVHQVNHSLCDALASD